MITLSGYNSFTEIQHQRRFGSIKGLGRVLFASLNIKLPPPQLLPQAKLITWSF
jgi:hypothetical protein